MLKPGNMILLMSPGRVKAMNESIFRCADRHTPTLAWTILLADRTLCTLI